MEPLSNVTVRVGPWHVKPSLNRMEADGTVVRVTPKVMDVLMCLTEAQGEVVTRDQLLDRVWPDTVVGGNVLTRAISDLRKAFDDDPQQPRFIETIPKTGYRLIAPVSFDYTGDASPAADVVIDVSAPHSDADEEPSTRGTQRLVGGLLLIALLGIGLAWVFTSSEPPSATSTQATPVTSLPGRELHPALSPDGHHVAFAWNGTTGDNWDLYVKLLGDATPLRLTEHPAVDAHPAWSPDGTRLAFLRYVDDTCHIVLTSALGASERRLASCGHNVNPDLTWSPDGRWLAYSDRPTPDAAYGIVLLSPETLERRQLTAPSDQHWGDRDPSFSPDGSTVAFTRSVSRATQDVFTAALDGVPPQRLTTDARTIRGHTWTPEGDHLVIASDRGGSTNLWKLPISGGAPTWIAAGGLNAQQPSMTPQHHRLLFTRQDVASDIKRLSLEHPGEVHAWLPSTRSEQHPQISPDGQRVAFVSNRSGSYELWTARLDGSQPTQLTTFGGGFVGNPRWSSDGKHLVFDARPNGHADLYTIQADGSGLRRLTKRPSNELEASWSHDGRWIYFGSNRTGAWQIWKLAADGGEAQQVTREGGYAALEAPDGRSLYVTKYDTPGLWRIELSDGTESRISDLQASSDWVATHEGLYVVQQTDAGFSLVLLDPATGRASTVASLPEQPAFGLTLSPDRQHLLYATASQQESDLMMIDELR